MYKIAYIYVHKNKHRFPIMSLIPQQLAVCFAPLVELTFVLHLWKFKTPTL